MITLFQIIAKPATSRKDEMHVHTHVVKGSAGSDREFAYGLIKHYLNNGLAVNRSWFTIIPDNATTETIKTSAISNEQMKAIVEEIESDLSKSN